MSMESPSQESDGQGVVKCISGHLYEKIRGVRTIFSGKDIRDGVIYAHRAIRKTVTTMDMPYVLKRQGCTLDSCGGHRITKPRRILL